MSEPMQPAGGGSLDVGAAFGYSWAKFQQHAGQLILIVLVVFGVSIVMNGIGFALAGDTPVLFLFWAVITWVVTQIVQLGVIRASLGVTRGEDPEVGKVFQTDHLGNWIVASILVGLMVGVGLVLCFIPGILALIYTSFYGYFVLDRGMAPVDAIKASFELVSGNAGSVFVLLLLAWLLGLAGAIACGIGLLVTIPMAWIMIAYAYRSLNNEPIAP